MVVDLPTTRVNKLFMDESIERLKELIAEKGWTWADFGREHNLSEQRLYNWRKRSIPIRSIMEVSGWFGVAPEWFGVAPEWLAAGKGEKRPSTYALQGKSAAGSTEIIGRAPTQAGLDEAMAILAGLDENEKAKVMEFAQLLRMRKKLNTSNRCRSSTIFRGRRMREGAVCPRVF